MCFALSVTACGGKDYSIYSIPQFSMINKAWLDDLGLRDDGTVEFVWVSDEYREAVTYFHDWYAEGLMDTEMFSQSDSQLISKCSQGYVGVATWWYIEEVMSDYADDYVFLPVLDGPDGTHNVTVRTGGGINSGSLNITKACKSPAKDRAIERLTDLYDFWMPYVDSTITYPVDCVFTSRELDDIDWYKADFESAVSEQEGLWLKNGGPTDEEWNDYIKHLRDKCGMDKLLKVYQEAYDRYES